MTGIFHLNLLLILACETQDFASPLWFATDCIGGKHGNFMTQHRGKGMKADQPAYVHHQRTDDLLG